jgi:hypothetical protein
MEQSLFSKFINQYSIYASYAGWATLAVGVGVAIEFLGDIIELIKDRYKEQIRFTKIFSTIWILPKLCLIVGSIMVIEGIYYEYLWTEKASYFLNQAQSVTQSGIDQINLEKMADAAAAATIRQDTWPSRSIPKEYMQQKINDLKSPRQKFEMITYPKCIECMDVKKNYSGALQQAGWIDVTPANATLKETVIGIYTLINSKADAKTQGAQIAMFNLLREARACCPPIYPDDSLPPDVIRIEIGLKQ